LARERERGIDAQVNLSSSGGVCGGVIHTKLKKTVEVVCVMKKMKKLFKLGKASCPSTTSKSSKSCEIPTEPEPLPIEPQTASIPAAAAAAGAANHETGQEETVQQRSIPTSSTTKNTNSSPTNASKMNTTPAAMPTSLSQDQIILPLLLLLLTFWFLYKPTKNNNNHNHLQPPRIGKPWWKRIKCRKQPPEEDSEDVLWESSGTVLQSSRSLPAQLCTLGNEEEEDEEKEEYYVSTALEGPQKSIREKSTLKKKKKQTWFPFTFFGQKSKQSDDSSSSENNVQEEEEEEETDHERFSRSYSHLTTLSHRFLILPPDCKLVQIPSTTTGGGKKKKNDDDIYIVSQIQFYFHIIWDIVLKIVTLEYMLQIAYWMLQVKKLKWRRFNRKEIVRRDSTINTSEYSAMSVENISIVHKRKSGGTEEDMEDDDTISISSRISMTHQNSQQFQRMNSHSSLSTAPIGNSTTSTAAAAAVVEPKPQSSQSSSSWWSSFMASDAATAQPSSVPFLPRPLSTPAATTTQAPTTTTQQQQPPTIINGETNENHEDANDEFTLEDDDDDMSLLKDTHEEHVEEDEELTSLKMCNASTPRIKPSASYEEAAQNEEEVDQERYKDYTPLMTGSNSSSYSGRHSPMSTISIEDSLCSINSPLLPQTPLHFEDSGDATTATQTTSTSRRKVKSPLPSPLNVIPPSPSLTSTTSQSQSQSSSQTPLQQLPSLALPILTSVRTGSTGKKKDALGKYQTPSSHFSIVGGPLQQQQQQFTKQSQYHLPPLIPPASSAVVVPTFSNGSGTSSLQHQQQQQQTSNSGRNFLLPRTNMVSDPNNQQQQQQQNTSIQTLKFFDAVNSNASLKKIVREVPVPDKNGYILGDEFISNYSSSSSREASYTPLLVFVNSRSGPQQGRFLIAQLKRLLNPIQVWDLADGGPEKVLESFMVFTRLRILVCGGDGTVSWILSVLEKMAPDRWPPIAILPLGTGNDLARMHGWGGGYNNESLSLILKQISEAYVSLLDRWELTVVDNKKKGNKVLDTKSFTNYLGVGVDAQAALQVCVLKRTCFLLFAKCNLILCVCFILCFLYALFFRLHTYVFVLLFLSFYVTSLPRYIHSFALHWSPKFPSFTSFVIAIQSSFFLESSTNFYTVCLVMKNLSWKHMLAFHVVSNFLQTVSKCHSLLIRRVSYFSISTHIQAVYHCGLMALNQREELLSVDTVMGTALLCQE